MFPFGAQNLTNEEQVVVIQARTVLTLAEKVMVAEWTLPGGVGLPAGPSCSAQEGGGATGRGAGRPPALSVWEVWHAHAWGTRQPLCMFANGRRRQALPQCRLYLFPPQRLGDVGVCETTGLLFSLTAPPGLLSPQLPCSVPPRSWNLPGAPQAGCQRPLLQASNRKRRSSNKGSGAGTGGSKSPQSAG